MTIKIILHELTLSCSIGIDAAEKYVRQRLLVDADITLAAPPSDDTAPVYDYARAVAQLRQLAVAQHYGLMETFAQAAAAALLEHPGAQAVRVYCRKPMPFTDLGSAGIEVRLPAADSSGENTEQNN